MTMNGMLGIISDKIWQPTTKTVYLREKTEQPVSVRIQIQFISNPKHTLFLLHELLQLDGLGSHRNKYILTHTNHDFIEEG